MPASIAVTFGFKNDQVVERARAWSARGSGMTFCATCGARIPSTQTSVPCGSCGSLDRRIDELDPGRGTDEAVQLSGQEGGSPRMWRDQWSRVLRWFERFGGTNDGRAHDVASPFYEDEVYAFFEACHHLKEWLKNDERLNLGSRVEDFVESSVALRWCADLANGSKHMRVNRRPRVDPDLRLGRQNFELALGTGPTEIAIRYDVASGKQARDAFELAVECVRAWESFLLQECLLTEADSGLSPELE